MRATVSKFNHYSIGSVGLGRSIANQPSERREAVPGEGEVKILQTHRAILLTI
jgi:hypothetical protein